MCRIDKSRLALLVVIVRKGNMNANSCKCGSNEQSGEGEQEKRIKNNKDTMGWLTRHLLEDQIKQVDTHKGMLACQT